MSSSSVLTDLQTSDAPPARSGGGWVIVALVVITLLGLGLRLREAHESNRYRPDSPDRLVGDEVGYEWLGSSVVDGYFFTWPGRVPGYSLFIASVYEIIGKRSVAAVLYAQALFATLTIPLTFALARRFVSQRLALWASAFVAVDPALLFQIPRMYTEAVYTPLIVLTVWLLYLAVDRKSLMLLALAGVVIAAMNLTRPVGVLLPSVLLVSLPLAWTIRRRLAALIVCSLAMCAAIAPWTIHNYRQYHRFIPLASSTAVLWQGSPEFYHLIHTKPFISIWYEELDPKHNGGHDPYWPDGDSYFTQRAIQSIKAEPVVYLKYCMAKSFYFWFGNSLTEISYPSAHDWSQMPVPRLRRARWVGIMIGRNIPWLGFAAVGILAIRRRLGRMMIVLAVIGYFWAIHSITFAEVRYSEPFHPLLAVLIVSALSLENSGRAGASWTWRQRTGCQPCTHGGRVWMLGA